MPPFLSHLLPYREAITGLRHSGRRRTLYFHVVLWMGSLFVALVLAEGVLRVFPGLLPIELLQLMRADPDNYGQSHAYIGHLHKPHNALVISGRDFHAVHHTDGHGFRNRWPWPNTAHIVTLGDSLTFGYGVEDHQAWPALVADGLTGIKLLNLGLIGAGPQQYLRVYETFGRRLRPKLLILGFFSQNDFWDAEMFDRWLQSGASGNYIVWRDFGRPRNVSLALPQPLGKFVKTLFWRADLLARKSRLYTFLLYAAGYIERWVPSEIKEYRTTSGARLELQPSGILKRAQEARPGFRGFDTAINALARLYSLASSSGSLLLVVLQPSKEEVYLPLLGQHPPDPSASLRAALDARGIPYLDLAPLFRSRSGEALFFEADGHPNATGYALIAEGILAHLRSHATKYGLQDSLQLSRRQEGQ